MDRLRPRARQQLRKPLAKSSVIDMGNMGDIDSSDPDDNATCEKCGKKHRDVVLESERLLFGRILYERSIRSSPPPLLSPHDQGILKEYLDFTVIKVQGTDPDRTEAFIDTKLMYSALPYIYRGDSIRNFLARNPLPDEILENFEGFWLRTSAEVERENHEAKKEGRTIQWDVPHEW